MPKDLQKTYNLFLSNLDGKMAVITTPFVKLDCFYVKFDILQLPHLLGLHKIYKDSPRISGSDVNGTRIYIPVGPNDGNSSNTWGTGY